jgi:hypothetical protein
MINVFIVSSDSDIFIKCENFDYFYPSKIVAMSRRIIFFLLIFISGCKTEKNDSYFTPEIALQYFGIIEEACNKDDGKLWGKNLYGPILFVERSTRRITANQPDKEGILKERNGIYTGIYPKELIINNRATSFGGTLYALVPLPREEDEFMIVSMAIHSLFHLYQESMGYTSSDFNIGIMDDKNARLWLKLEWKALRKAIDTEGPAKHLAIRDALIFRGSNRESYHNYVNDEIRFENYEGLATFTNILLSTDSPEEYKKRLFESLEWVYSFQSYARSYGFIHGALYATLMYQKGFDFSTIDIENVDLANIVKELYDIECPEVCRDVAGSIAINYDLETIVDEETERDREISERIHRRISKFVEKPVVLLELESPYFDFEFEDIRSLDTLGTIYNEIRVSDNWGKLTVDKGGCLVSNNLKYLRITAKGLIEERNRIEGEGWHLILNNNWKIVQVDQNYFVRKEM